jgi:hypothetical protein
MFDDLSRFLRAEHGQKPVDGVVTQTRDGPRAFVRGQRVKEGFDLFRVEFIDEFL